MFKAVCCRIAACSVDMRVQRQFQAQRQMIRNPTRGRTAVEGLWSTIGIEQTVVDHREAGTGGVTQPHLIEQPRTEQQVIDRVPSVPEMIAPRRRCAGLVTEPRTEQLQRRGGRRDGGR